MHSQGITKAKIWLIVLVSVVALAVAAGALFAGVFEAGRTSPPKAASTTPSKQSSVTTARPLVPATAAPTQSAVSSPPPPAASLETAEAPAFVPEVVRTVQASVPSQQPARRPAQTSQQPSCPSGTVISGLTDVTVAGEKEWMVGTLVDLVGHGAVVNRTTAAVSVSLSLPYVQGLDSNGRLTMNSFTGDFDYAPPLGQPRPGSVSLAPGESITYTFAAKEVTSKTMSATVAWYSDPKYTVYGYSDIPATSLCPAPAVASPPGGASIMNTYVPRAQ